MVVEKLWTKLRERVPPYGEKLIGIDSKAEQLESLLKIGLNDVLFVGGVGQLLKEMAKFTYKENFFHISK